MDISLTYKKLEFLFLITIVISANILLFNYYNSYSFKHNSLPKSYLERISKKEQDVLAHMQKNCGLKIPGRLYGLTSYENG